MTSSYTKKKKRKKKSHLSVLVEMATIPSGHCSEANPDAYSRDSYDSGVKWNLF